MPEFCPHCQPTRRTHHLDQHLAFYAEAWMEALPPFARKLVTFGHGERGDRWWRAILRAGLKMGAIQAKTVIDEKIYRNRELIFWREAKRRGLDVAALELGGTPLNEFRWNIRGRTSFYEGNPLHLFASPASVGNKIAQKRKLEAAGIPVANGARFVTEEAGVAFALSLDVPIVVKPNAGSLSHHVSVNVVGEAAVRQAIKIAQEYRPDYVVEAFVSGRLYRATVIGREKVFVCRKDAPNVVGDGRSSIRELIATKNAHPCRGETQDRSSTLHKIRLEDVKEDMERVPKVGERVQLMDKCILSRGCDIVACTSAVHPDNLALFLQVAEVMEMDLVGIDFLCADIAASWKYQPSAVLETNSMPYLDMHQFPSEGEAEDVAGETWEWVLRNMGK